MGDAGEKQQLHGPSYDMRALGFVSGETVVVTGAGSGIGKATALAAARSGLNVAVWDIVGDSAVETAREAKDLGVEALAVTVDVADAAAVADAWEGTLPLGACRYLVNNAGPPSLAEGAFADNLAIALGSVELVTSQWLARCGEEAASVVSLASIAIAFPIAYFAARHARGRWKAAFYLCVMLPLWSSYLVKIYAWKMILAKEGIVSWAAAGLHLGWLLDGILGLPVIGGPSLSISYIGTFLVFVYVWLPFMILPMQAALERVPATLLEASADLGAGAGQTFRHVILPLAIPGIVAGSIFTFSLTLGDYIVPQIIGNSANFIGMAVYQQQGTAGNIPLAAAFAVVPIVIMMAYLWFAKRMGAFDAL